MASITRHPNGRREIQFVAPDGKRRTIRLGKMPQKQAEAVKLRVEHLVSAKFSGHALDAETARWVSELELGLAERLARVGLIPKPESARLEEFLESYLESRADLKPRTIKKLKTTRDRMVEFFGGERSLRDMNEGDADDWRLSMVTKGLSENTVRKHIAIAKQFFAKALRKKMIPTNPFADLKSTVQPNPSRFYFISQEEAEKVIAACPDAEWRLIFALSRYGGLRCPSEHLGLRWEDLDWETGRFRVSSPKTEHHAGGDSRMVPIFPELRPFLEECKQLAKPGAEFVITRYRDSNTNLRTQLERIIKRAGVKKWPKLFQNLRSTRQTELEEEFPSHVVCAWIGNSQAIASKHYLQVTDAHFAKALQNPMQQSTETPRNRSKPSNSGNSQVVTYQAFAKYHDLLQCTKVAVEGLEPPTRGL